MASVTLERVQKAFGDLTVVRDIDLEIGDGDFVCLLGPSGCGKTTTLRMVAGLEQPTAGRILIGGADVTRKPPRDRNLSMVFQDYALYPHMSLGQNIGYPLKVRGAAVDARRGRTQEVADILQIGHLLDRLPSQISGGQQQRASLARALVHPSQVYLFDEPLSNLDAKLRLEARAFLNHLQRDIGMTAIYVTHDQAEAMALATRVAVMEAGQVVQYAPPLEVYRRPATTFVAGFVGNPPMNLVPVQAARQDGTAVLTADGLQAPPLPLWDALARAIDRGPKLTLGIRPEHLRVAGDDDWHLSGELFANEGMGPESLVTLLLPGDRRVTARIFGDEPLRLDRTVRLGFRAEDAVVFDAEGRRIPGAREEP
ncbi:MAG: ABC transporter ATP-binding protein [Inquilinus sp.]|uniref:ABC transporter ATP-binding protein n=1 Tax=Inquilinus sp. TaxID=1932117 RepID=UPI003F3F3307